MSTFGEETNGYDSPFFLAMLQHRAQTGLFQTRQEFSSVYYTSDGQRRLVILYLDNETGKHVSKKYFEIVDVFIAQQFRELILVTTTGLNPEHNNRVRTRMPNYKVEVFLDAELAFNRTKHAYAPIEVTHIPGNQKSEWGRQEGIRPEKLPMMLDTDIIAKWHGAQPLDVFQMELLGTTTDTFGYNRIVRMAPAKT
jgi:DNA-directed RNA polymerase subunit H (RpoH/RPB5)